MQTLPPEIIWIFQLVFSFGSMLLMLRLFGVWGITVYMCVALIGANLQVLKAVQFSLFESPVALGTVLFSTTFLSTDILTEYFGPKEARRAVLLGFAGMILLTLFMLLAIGFTPLSEQYIDSDWAWGRENHEHISALFMPVPAILLAGFLAYLTSQILDIWIYQRIRSMTHNRFRWLRNNVSTWVSALIDNTVFSILAWVIFADQALPWGVVWKTYIFGTYFIRMGVALLDTPVLYLAKYCLPKQSTNNAHGPSS